jgi:hypothetical protein
MVCSYLTQLITKAARKSHEARGNFASSTDEKANHESPKVRKREKSISRAARHFLFRAFFISGFRDSAMTFAVGGPT